MATLRQIGAQLRSQRRARGQTQQETAAALGMTRQWLARVEAGTGNPDLRQLLALCEQLGLDLVASQPAPDTATPPPEATGEDPRREALHPPLGDRHRQASLSAQVDLDQLLRGFTDQEPAAPRPPRPGLSEGTPTS